MLPLRPKLCSPHAAPSRCKEDSSIATYVLMEPQGLLCTPPLASE